MVKIPASVSKALYRGALVVQKHSPTILFVGGVAGSITSTVLACRATLKLSDELPEMKKRLEVISHDQTIPEQDRNRMVAFAYLNNLAKVGALYAPSVVVGTLSISALTGSHVVLNRRNAGLTAAYAAVSKAYDEYRNRVREEMGEDRELDLYHAATVEKVQVEGQDKKQEVKVVDPEKGSPYARFFDECSREYQKNSELNRLFLEVQQQHANDMLTVRGHVFLNDVYDALGFERTTAGAVVGWVQNGEGDGYIDFGMYKARNNRFINSIENTPYLDFNVDGVIYDKI